MTLSISVQHGSLVKCCQCNEIRNQEQNHDLQ